MPYLSRGLRYLVVLRCAVFFYLHPSGAFFYRRTDGILKGALLFFVYCGILWCYGVLRLVK